MARKKETQPQKEARDTRGREVMYDEYKKDVTVTLTPTAAQNLSKMAKARKLTRSEFLEKIGRGEISVESKVEMMGECLASLQKTA